MKVNNAYNAFILNSEEIEETEGELCCTGCTTPQPPSTARAQAYDVEGGTKYIEKTATRFQSTIQRETIFVCG